MPRVDAGVRHLDRVEAVLGSVMRHARVPHQLVCVDGDVTLCVWAERATSGRGEPRTPVRSRCTITDLRDRVGRRERLDAAAVRVLDEWNRGDRIAAASCHRRSGLLVAGVTLYCDAKARDLADVVAFLAAASAHEVLVDGGPLRALAGGEPHETSLALLELASRIAFSSPDPVPLPPRFRSHARYRFAAKGLAVTSGDEVTLDVDPTARHPLFGPGVSLTLELPVDLIDRDLAAAVASELNETEATIPTGIAGYGAWATVNGRPHHVAHVTFLPNAVAQLIGVETLIREEQRRATWAARQLRRSWLIGAGAWCCAACGRPDANMTAVLRVSADFTDAPGGTIFDGAVGTDVDGHLPLCSICLPPCAVCRKPWPTDPVRELQRQFEPMVADDRMYLGWVVEGCHDPSHGPIERGTPR